MIIEFKEEMTLRNRAVLLLMVPFAALVGGVLISQFGVFGSEAYNLISSIFQGDLSRVGDFLGYLLVLFLSVIVTGFLIAATLYGAIIQPNLRVKFDSDRRVVDVKFYPVWSKPRGMTYGFNEVQAVELSHDGEDSRIRLRLPDRRWPLTIHVTYDHQEAEHKFAQLRHIGLPCT